jgi:hypothetical protein
MLHAQNEHEGCEHVYSDEDGDDDVDELQDGPNSDHDVVVRDSRSAERDVFSNWSAWSLDHES